MLVSVIQKIYISIPNVLIVVFSSVSNFNFKFSLVTSYFQNFMFFPAKLSKLRTKNKKQKNEILWGVHKLVREWCARKHGYGHSLSELFMQCRCGCRTCARHPAVTQSKTL